jgi:4-amino-4-deoxy-L-arabinose transferase-like glycosyltransferase
MVLLLPSAWLAGFLIFRKLAARNRLPADWRFSFILACALWGAVLVLGTEILSLFVSFNAVSVLLFWLCVNVCLWGGLYRFSNLASAGGDRPLTPSLSPSDGEKVSEGRERGSAGWPLDAKILLAVALLFAAFLGGIALLTPTTNWDSLTYHLPRVLHWIQNQNVAHFPTNMAAQIQMGPWPAFVEAHLWLLWGGDRLANLPQWCAMLGCLVIATLIVRQLLPAAAGAMGARAQAFAAVLVVTLPTGIVESITPQTDYLTAFWLLSLASLGLEWCRQPRCALLAAGFGVVLGLGSITKLTFPLFGFPIGLATAAVLLWQQRRAPRPIFVQAAGALVLCLALVLPHLIRNQRAFGSVLGWQAIQQNQVVGHFSLSSLIFNVIHNAELQSNTGIEPLTRRLNQFARAVEGWTGCRADDPELSYPGSLYQAPDEFFVFDSFAASPWHAGLIAVAVLVGLLRPRQNRLALAGMALAFAGFTLFCALLLWQIWNSRYHLPFLVLSLPLAAALLAPRLNRWLICAIAAGLFVFAMIIVANNRSRPVFDPAWRAQPRMQQMFSFMGTKFYGPMRGAVKEITAMNCGEVGLKLWPDTPEYPLWLMLREAGFKGGIYHVLVEGPASRLPEAGGTPDVIVTSRAGHPAGDLAVQYPTATEISVRGADGATNVLFSLYWSAKISERRAQMNK